MYMYFKVHVHVIAKAEGTIVLQMNIYNVYCKVIACFDHVYRGGETEGVRAYHSRRSGIGNHSKRTRYVLLVNRK